MSPRVVIVDLFDVITSDVAPYWLAEHFSHQQALEVKATLVHEADLGTISESEMFDQLAALCGINAAQISAEWRSYVHVDHAVVDLVSRLRPHYTVGLLTNAPSQFVRSILEENRLTGS